MHFITWLGYRALFNSASPTRRARKWEPKVDLVVGVGAPAVRTGDELFRFSYPGNFSNSDFITVFKIASIWVVTDIFHYRSFFPSIVISDRRSSCCQVYKLVSSRSHTAAIALGPNYNRKRSSPIKYDGLTHTVLEKAFRPVYYRWKCRSIVFVRKFSRGKCSCADDKTFVLLHTGLTMFPRKLPEIRIRTWYGRIISKKAKIRIGYGWSVPCGMSATLYLNICWKSSITVCVSRKKMTLVLNTLCIPRKKLAKSDNRI